MTCYLCTYDKPELHTCPGCGFDICDRCFDFELCDRCAFDKPKLSPLRCGICKHGPCSWRFDGVQHVGECDGGLCYRSFTCRRSGGTLYNDLVCPEHTRSEAIEITLEVANG